jgi:hypothetical protein
MTHYLDHSPPSDVCLMLRAHAEQRWLSREVVPVLRQLQTPGGLPEEQLGAALAYLEVTWLEAARLAAETDAACANLDDTATDTEETLPSKARSYHAAVRTLREVVARNVTTLIAAPGNMSADEHEHSDGTPTPWVGWRASSSSLG